MKTIKMITLGMMLLFASSSMNAQLSINVNLGGGGMQPPAWAPVNNASAGYYYIPDIQCYYDVQAAQFIYLNAGVWIRSNNLPNYCRNYNLNSGYIVGLNGYQGSTPYANYNYHKVRYYKGYRGVPQQNVGYRYQQNYNNNNYNYNNYNRDNNYRHDNDYNNYNRGNYDHDNHRGDENRGGHDNHGNGYRH